MKPSHHLLAFPLVVILLAACIPEKKEEHKMEANCSEASCMDSCRAQGQVGTCYNDACQCQDADGGMGGDAGTPSPDAGVTTGADPGSGCTCDRDCAGTAANPGVCMHGVCMQVATGPCSGSGSQAECPAGSRCWAAGGSDLYVCWPDCDAHPSCAGSCDTDGSCSYTTSTTCDPHCGTACGSPTQAAVGDPCSAHDDCPGGDNAQCYPTMSGQDPTGFANGYCMIFNCTSSSCPAGSTCATVRSSSGGNLKICLADCATGEDCRAGYECRESDNTCWPGCTTNDDCPAAHECRGWVCVPSRFFCGPVNSAGWCPESQWCNNGTCETFNCQPDGSEPNQTRGAARDPASGVTDGLSICAGDEDWWRITVPAGHITTVVLNHDIRLGDIDLVSHNAAGTVIDSRTGFYPYSVSWRSYETGTEAVSFYNEAGADAEYFLRVVGASSGAQSPYSLAVVNTPYTDGENCTTAGYSSDDCQGRGPGGSGLMNFPLPDPDDTYVGAGYMFDSVSNYRWLRREAIMMIRHAIHLTQAQFPNTNPIGLIDMCQIDGITPGYDVNDPRHPESTHDQGGNFDIAYYSTLADNHARVICGPNENNTDGYFCTNAATTQHVVDLPRQVYFMAQLFSNPRLRVIGVDKVIAPLLLAEADRQAAAGTITAAQKGAFSSKMAYGDGWPFHHHHIHVSLRWW
jgi:hypothetical protein